MTFDTNAATFTYRQPEWKHHFELFCVCRNCQRSTIFSVSQINYGVGDRIDGYIANNTTLNTLYEYKGFVGLKDVVSVAPPEHLPPPIDAIFREAASCLSVQCWNAAAVMLRLCIDVVTRSMLPTDAVVGLNYRTRRDLGLRLDWLLSNGHLSTDLRALSACVHQDGNDAAHVGSLTKEDAEDLLDFAEALLERIYTEPARLKLAEERRAARRSAQNSA